MAILDGKTPDLAAENIKKLKNIFPDVFEEGKIDYEKLKQDLGEYVDDEKERYNFSWNGKGRALRLSQTPSAGTLRPCPEESKNWDSTKNLYIEGDNLEVLKLLQKSYHGKVKMIYIDPPYNTGNDFVYPDNFADTIENYKEITGQVDSEGHNYGNNSETNGHYHTDWLNMMLPRLRLARNLLTDDGVIFISIDDNEAANLKKICDEVFGEENFVSQLVWEKKKKGSFLSNSITNIKEYVLVYCKTNLSFKGLIGEINTNTETYPCINASNKRELRIIPAGIESKYKESDYFLKKGSEISDTTMSIVLHSDLVIEKGILAQDLTLEGNWRYSQSAMTEYANKHELYITRDLYLRRIVNEARYKTLKDILPRTGDDNNASYNAKIDTNNLLNSGWGSNEDADEELRLIFGIQKLMDYPKPVRLLEKLLSSARDKECIVLDFFSGSATTAHAVMQLNAEDGGNRRFLMVQLPEPCPEGSEAAKAGYKNICEIGKERIRRAGEKIKTEVEEQNAQLKLDEEPKKVPDIGFQVFKLDSSNLKKWNTEAGMVKDYADGSEQLNFSEKKLAEDLQAAIENYIPGRTEQDVVYEILLKMGFDLTWPVEKKVAAGKKVYVVALGALMLCLENNITPDVARGMAELHKQLAPETWKVVFRDNGFASDSDKVNVHEILKSAGLEEDAFTTV